MIRIAPLDHSYPKAAGSIAAQPSSIDALVAGRASFPLELPVLTAQQIKQQEQRLSVDQPPHSLMLHAAQSATRWLLAHLALRPAQQRMVVLCGPGNNGGDGALIAAALDAAGFHVDVVRSEPSAQIPVDAQFAWRQCPLTVIKPTDALPDLAASDVVIDALFGIGQNRAVEPAIQALLNWANQQPAARVAIDIPTGLNPITACAFDDATGEPFIADYTLAFIAPTVALLTGAGRHYSGQVYCDSLGSAPQAQPLVLTTRPNQADFKPLLRRADSHKGHYGGVFVVGGAVGITGALYLAARCALSCGAGKVWIASLAGATDAALVEPALMSCPLKLEAVLQLNHNVTVIGPGLGQDKDAVKAVAVFLTSAKLPITALVIDADALNVIAQEKKLALALRRYSGAKVLTPHPLEAARLLNLTTAQVQADRVGSARALSELFAAVVVLKGSGTVIAQPSGATALLPVGNPLLASAGTGDVLAGTIAALLAQGLDAVTAARAGVVCHGLAASAALTQLPGAIGLTASELIPLVRAQLNSLVAQSSSRF